MTEEKWTLEEFYTELFNFCFPINYRMQMRKKLNHTFQKDKTVNQYAFELEEIYNMIGGYSQRDKVIKLWNDKLNPEISSQAWRKVLAAAEIIEIAESVNGASKESKTNSYSGSVLPSNKRKEHRRKSHKNSKDSSRGGSIIHASGSQPRPPSVRKNSNPRYPSKDNRSQFSRGRGGCPRFGSTPRRDFVKKEPVDYGLPDKEKAARLAEGRCFGCNEIGHLGRNSPHRNSVKHIGNKPPGVSNFIMELVGESLPSDSNSAEVLDSLPLRHVSFKNCEETDLFPSSSLSRPDWMRLSEQKPRNKIGDAFARGTGKFAWQLACVACMPMSLRELA